MNTQWRYTICSQHIMRLRISSKSLHAHSRLCVKWILKRTYVQHVWFMKWKYVVIIQNYIQSNIKFLRHSSNSFNEFKEMLRTFGLILWVYYGAGAVWEHLLIILIHWQITSNWPSVLFYKCVRCLMQFLFTVICTVRTEVVLNSFKGSVIAPAAICEHFTNCTLKYTVTNEKMIPKLSISGFFSFFFFVCSFYCILCIRKSLSWKQVN